PVAKATDGQARNRRERCLVMPVDDEPRDVVDLVSDDEVLEKRFQRHVGERVLCGDALFCALGGNTGKLVAAARRRRFGEKRLQIVEGIVSAAERGLVHQSFSNRTSMFAPSYSCCPCAARRKQALHS